MRKKRVIFAVVTLLLYLLVFTSCFADVFAATITIPRVESNVYIYDQDNAINDDTEKRLNQLLIDLEKKTSVEFAVVTVPTLNGMSIEDYSIKLANSLGIGKKSSNNGILLIYTKSEKDLGPSTRLEIGSGMEGILNDAKCGRILDQYFVPYREENKYTEATDYTVRAIITILSEEYNVSILSDDETLSVTDSNLVETWNKLPTWLKILIIIIIILMIIGAIYAEDGEGSSSGGFFSSGGGFSSGGFGGGGFSGGGASR